MKRLVDQLDKRQDAHDMALADVREMGKAHETVLSNLYKAGDRKNERTFTVMLMIPTWLIAVVTVTLEVVHAFHG